MPKEPFSVEKITCPRAKIDSTHALLENLFCSLSGASPSVRVECILLVLGRERVRRKPEGKEGEAGVGNSDEC